MRSKVELQDGAKVELQDGLKCNCMMRSKV